MQLYNRKTYTNPVSFYLLEKERNLLEALRKKSEETYLHSVSVSRLAVELGISCRLSRRALGVLGKGGLLHDVGKLEVPDDILNKKGSLDAEEAKVMHSHSAYGEKLLRSAADERDEAVLNIVRHHHEKINGNGYPDGICERLFLVQIITVADIYNALRSNRCYRKGYGREKAFAILYSDNGINHHIVDRLYMLCSTGE